MNNGPVGLWVAFWPRVGLVGVWVGIPVLLVGLTLWWGTRRRRGGDALAGPARAGRLAGLALGALVGTAAVWSAQAWCAPAAVADGYLLGTATGELRDAPAPTEPVRVASLDVRDAARYVPRWAAATALAAAAVTILSPVVFAAAPRVRYGPWRPDPGDPLTLPGGTLAWPSAALSVPFAVIAAATLVVGGLLVRRVTGLPARAADRPGLHEPARHNAARAVAGAVLGVELMVLGALAVAASSGLAVPGARGGAAYTGSRVLVRAGLGLAAAGVLAWCVLGWWRRGPGGTARAADVSPA